MFCCIGKKSTNDPNTSDGVALAESAAAATATEAKVEDVQIETLTEKSGVPDLTKPVTPPPGKSEYEAHDEEEDEDENDDDVMSEAEFLKNNPPPGGQRQAKMRSSVSAEAYGEWNKKDDNYIAPIFEKNEEQKKRLAETLSKSFMFGALSHLEMDTIVNAMEEVDAKAGERLITLGQNGDYLFVIEKGTLECRKEINGTDTLLKTVEEGDVFGELALLYNTVRAANVDAKTDCILWKLDRNTFTHIVAGAAQKKREKYEGFLSKVPLLQHMDHYSRSQLCDGLKVESFESGSTIITEGEEGNSFYIIESGTATGVKKGSEDKALEYKSGDFFGELALLQDVPRAATVTTTSKVECLVLDRAAFKRLFGGSKKMIDAMKKDY